MKLSDWIKDKREKWRSRSFKRSETDFCGQVQYGRYDAVLQSIERNKLFPSVTKEQARILWDSCFFRDIGQTSQKGWHRVMDALKRTEWGERQNWQLSGLKAGNETLSQKLNAQYVLLCGQNTGGNDRACPCMEQEEVRAAHRLIGYCMKEQELLELKEFALSGKRPGDLTAIRYGLLDGFMKIEDWRRERAEEMRGDNHRTADGIDMRIAGENGKLMRTAAGLYEKKLDGKLPEDYLKVLRYERDMLYELSKNGWDGIMEVPKSLQMKYGMAEPFHRASNLLLDYVVRCDLGDDSYPETGMRRCNKEIKSRSREGLAYLEKKLSPHASVSGHRTAHPDAYRFSRCRQEQAKKQPKGIKMKF